MTTEERAELRRAIIAGPTDCPLDPKEAAAFLGISETSVRTLDLPRAMIAGRPKYMKSELILYVRNRLSHQLVA